MRDCASAGRGPLAAMAKRPLSRWLCGPGPAAVGRVNLSTNLDPIQYPVAAKGGPRGDSDEPF